MLSYAFIDGYTEAPRHHAIARLKSAIADVDGVITDFAFFSNRALRLSVEVELGSLPRLRAALEDGSVTLFDRCVEELEKTEKTLLESAKHRPVVVMLHVAFLAEDAAQPSAHA